jgi:V8-like Glu-specific endopeptidase
LACRIAGYPGGLNRQLYKHIDRITGVRQTDDGGIKLRYECDASPGMCGASIMIEVPDFVSEKRSQYPDLAKFQSLNKCMVAVHNNGHVAANVNEGTMITDEIDDWISDVVELIEH